MRDFFGNEKYRKIIIAFWVTFMVAIVTFVVIFIGFSKKLKSTADMGLLNVNTVNTVLPNTTTITKTASSSEDKDINEVANEVLNKIENSTSATTQNVTAQKKVTETDISTTEINNNVVDTSTKEIDKEVEEVKPLEFMAPVSGEIITDFADESLIYSNTLEEWTTHLGVDIKADKASAVVASESGTIKSIKNDPRYGLTITISHNDGYESVYSNLLSSEFVSEGDEVEKGKTIGTVGESASFEVAEVPHLHFEVYKNGEVVNPTTVLK